MQCRFLERSIERLQKQNEHIQHHLAKQNEQLDRFKNSFDSLSERFAYKGYFEQEQQKIEQVRINLRDFQDFYYETLDEQTRNKFVRQIWKINLFDETKKS